ncbi:MAG: MinD/ParA family protein [Sphaerospermopsis kisseleviana]|uniref:Cobyrinic acid ac-diamide synthase n=1 Tax=Sphaerospermopsis reniformis TaxID=531300 RepID=A0A480A391_9CYAN|nr:MULTISPECIES: MinD/ParA family protein [Sphaerospermopsis]MBD2131927.1 MinD/ParA family protein [Sphaerospermopsis sp. FACHB-1094]GCL37978.1 Cobyrinic acid ac-diamide synthase [Sphaerospermopsis reniformis]
MSKIISIHSYRGGTGKSNTTANLATLVASQGHRVGIIDTDLPSPGIHILFGLGDLQGRTTLNDFLWGKNKISDAAHDVSYVLEGQGTPNSKLYLVPASVKVNDISRILRQGFDPELLFAGYEHLIKTLNLDYLFIDTHPGLSEETLLSLTASQVVLLILRPDQQDFQGTAVTVDVASRLKVPQMFLIVNKALPEYDFEQMSQQVTNTYNVPVLGILPDSQDMLRLASQGIFTIKYKNHAISKVMQRMAQQITGKTFTI